MSARVPVSKMYKLFIGGKFTRTESERYISVLNRKTGKKLCNVSRASRKDIRNAVTAARAGFNTWSAKTPYERSQIIYRLAEMLEGRNEQITNEIYLTTSKTRNEAAKETLKAIDRIIWYAGLCDKYGQLIGSVNDVQSGYFNFSIAEPSGVAAILLPEEMPFLALITRLCAVLTAGNSAVVLTSESSPLPALTFSEIAATSDIPGGVINIITGNKKELVPHLASHMDVNSFDYAESNMKFKKEVMELCSNNVKRFIFSAAANPKDYFNDDISEDISHVRNFTELKTVWHTMGY